jgi:hypothetical protein
MLDNTQHEQGVKGPSYMLTTYIHPVWSSCWRRVAVGCTRKVGYMIGVDSAMELWNYKSLVHLGAKSRRYPMCM